MKTNKPAGFWVRLIGFALDNNIHGLPVVIVIYNLSTARNVEELVSNLISSLALIIFPLLLLGFFLKPFLTSKFRTTIGKFVTGLEVTNTDGTNLTLGRSLFRYLIGYQLSYLVFGLGFLAVTRDPEKRAWHDKAAGTKVSVVRNTWPIGLLLLLVTSGLIFWLVLNSIQNLVNNTLLKTDAAVLFSQYAQQNKRDGFNETREYRLKLDGGEENSPYKTN